MKKGNIAQITPFLLDGHLIISFDQKWIEVCNGIPKFTVMIDNLGRLILLGPVVSLDNKSVWAMKNYEEKPEDELEYAVNIILKCQRCDRLFFSEPNFREWVIGVDIENVRYIKKT